MNRIGDGAFEFISDTEDRYWAALFFLGLFGYTLALVLEARSYGSDPRLFPLIVGLPLLGLLLVKVVQLVGGDRFAVDVSSVFEDVGEFDAVKSGEEVDPVDQYRNEFLMVLWTFAAVGLVWAFGLLPALAIYVFAFVYFYERSLLRAVVVTAVTYGFVYLLFIELLGAALYRGQFPLGGVL